MKALALVMALSFAVAAEPAVPGPASEPVPSAESQNTDPINLPPTDDTDDQSLECVLLQEFC